MDQQLVQRTLVLKVEIQNIYSERNEHTDLDKRGLRNDVDAIHLIARAGKVADPPKRQESKAINPAPKAQETKAAASAPAPAPKK